MCEKRRLFISHTEFPGSGRNQCCEAEILIQEQDLNELFTLSFFTGVSGACDSL
jgi:hypothetical protein